MMDVPLKIAATLGLILGSDDQGDPAVPALLRAEQRGHTHHLCRQHLGSQVHNSYWRITGYRLDFG